MTRIEQDIAQLKQERPDLIIGTNKSHVIVPNFMLPPGIYSAKTIRLLIDIPPTYPTAPPDNFHVAWGLELTNKLPIKNYSGPAVLHGENIGTFSFHVEPGGWDPNQDNLITFLTAVYGRLLEGA